MRTFKACRVAAVNPPSKAWLICRGRSRGVFASATLVLALLSAQSEALGQTRVEKARMRDRAHLLLNDLHADMKREYYDASFHGIDMDAVKRLTESAIDRAENDEERMAAIHRYLDTLNDSHTALIPPDNADPVRLGFTARFYGEGAFIVDVESGSAADSAGLRRGDRILAIGGDKPNRETWQRDLVRKYMRPSMTLPVTLQGPNGSLSDVELRTTGGKDQFVSEGWMNKRLAAMEDSLEAASAHRQLSIKDTVFLWRMPQFTHADKGIKQVMERVSKHGVLILDLRGNGGGSVATLTKMVGHFVDRSVPVGQLRMRFRKDDYVAKPEKRNFKGRIYILVDSETASAAEIFARLLQLEQRAVVIGDRTAGAVMASYFHIYGEGTYWGYGASITVSDVVLHDGSRLEKVGVTPDQFAIPSAQHIATGADPVLEHALALAGIPTTAATAGKLLGPR